MSSSRRVCVNTLCKATAASRLCGYLSNVLERWRQDVRHSDRLDRGGFTVLVALTVMILVTAALLTRTLSKLESVDPGLTAERLVLVDLAATEVRRPDEAPTTSRRIDHAPPNRVVDQRRHAGERPAVRRLKMGGFDSRDPWLTVVGVAALTRYRDLTRPRPTLYVPFETDVRNSMIVAAVAVMLATSFAACYVPVRRAMRIDPCSLLQAE